MAVRDVSEQVIVIGAGVIGVSAALALQIRGFAVTVIDRARDGQGASYGNAGAFAFADVIPLATPGILRKAPLWLIDPLGPLTIPPAYAPRLAPWMLRFWRASRRDQYASGLAAQSSLMALSRAALERQIADIGGEDLVRRDGQLQLYEGAAAYRASLPEWAARRAEGVRFDPLSGAGAIAEIQPGIDSRFTHAVFTPDWINTTDPAAWMRRLTACFVARGGRIEAGEARSLSSRENGVEVGTDAGARAAAHVVVAAGAWSHRLARSLGERIPLETERGYNTTLPPGAFQLRTHLTFPGHGFVVTRIAEGVRVGGAVELAGLERPPNFRRASALLDKAARFLPGLRTEGGAPWMGFRPSLPDTLPAIGRAARDARVLYAFGHGHLGLTQAAATAEVIAALLTRSAPPIDLAPFAPGRF